MNTALVIVSTVAIVATIALGLRPQLRRQLDTVPAKTDVPRRRFPSLPAWRPSITRTPAPEAVADWCDDIARRLRAGATLRECLEVVLPSDPATRARTVALRLALERGRSTNTALEASGASDGTHLPLARSVMQTAATHGGPAAVAIDRTAAVLRQRAADREERVAQAAQARLSAHVLTAVPLAMLLLLVVTDGDVRAVILTPLGATMIGVGLLLNTGGWCWMRRIVGATW